jgi:EmrB/QacA subfamily drug resistance transporter
MAMVLDLFPRERHGRAIGVWGMASMVAPAVGPTLGGWLVTSVSWHWLFLVNVPIGVVTLGAGLRLLPDVGHRSRRPFDARGLVLGAGGLALGVLGLSEATTWGWGSTPTLGCLALAAVLLAAFVRWQLAAAHPLIELRMFLEPTFRVAMVAIGFVYIAQYGRLVYLPLQLEGVRGESALTVGLLFLPAAIASAIGMSVGGRMADRIGPRLPVLLGCSCVLVALVGLSQLRLTTPLAWIGVVLCSQGVGQGLIAAPAMTAGLSDLPPELTAQGAAVRSLLNQVCGALAVAVLGTVVATRAGSDPTPVEAQAAYGTAFAVAAAGVAVALVMARRLPRDVARTDDAVTPERALALESPGP